MDTARALAVGVACGVAAAIVLCACTACAILWHLAHAIPSRARAVPYESVAWRTGDIVLTTHFDNDFSSIVKKGMPNHAGLVWVHPTHGVCILETACQSFATGNEPVCVVANACTFCGTRIIRLADYTHAYPYLCIYRRPYLGPRIDDAEMTAVVDTSMHLPFEPLLSPTAQPGFFMGAAMISMPAPLGRVGKLLVSQTRSSAAPLMGSGVICSELVIQILQAVKVISSNADAMLTPTGMATPSGMLDRIAPGVWGDEERVIPKPQQ